MALCFFVVAKQTTLIPNTFRNAPLEFELFFDSLMKKTFA